MHSLIPFSMVCSFQFSIKVDQLLNDGKREQRGGDHGTKDVRRGKKKPQGSTILTSESLKWRGLHCVFSPFGDQHDLVVVILAFLSSTTQASM